MKLGTSSLVVAAFVGPGTVLTCASAGVGFGYGLAWVLLFATAGVFVLQSFTAGMGILVGKGLGEALREVATTPLRRGLVYGLVVLGLWVGCAAFETGNLVGAASGLAAVLGGGVPVRVLVVALALAAAVLLMLDLRRLTQALAALVALMGLLFLAALVIAPVDWGAALRGLVVPTLPDGSLVTVVALLGTTIVTYNLFLHAAATKGYWAGTPVQAAWRQELRGMVVFLPLGGLISFAILAAGATLAGQGGTATAVADYAALLEPVAGPAARYLFGLGLFAAGLTSAITAPLAAAAGIREMFGWDEERQAQRFRAVWASVLAVGALFSLADVSPLRVIIAAQAANGVLLPFIAAFMLYLTARQQALNLSRTHLVAGILITLVCAAFGFRTLAWVWGQLVVGF